MTHRKFIVVPRLAKPKPVVMLFVLGFLGAAAPSGLVNAQQSNTESAVQDEPSNTTATYGDWLVRCRKLPMPSVTAETQAAEAGQKICEMVHIVQVARQIDPAQPAGHGAAQPQVLAQIAIGRLPDASSTKIVVQLPSGIWLRTAPTLALGESQGNLSDADQDTLLTLAFFRCLADVCFADLELTAAQENGMVESRFAQLSFAGAPEQVLNIPISMNGFSSAFDAIKR